MMGLAMVVGGATAALAPAAWAAPQPLAEPQVIQIRGSTSVTGPATDLDGDGYDDLVVCVSWFRSEVQIFRGGPHGLEDKPAVTLRGYQPDDQFGNDAIGVGDFDADGIQDLLVGASGANDWEGAVYVYSGSELFQTQPPYITFSEENGRGIGGPLVGGDINGDGVDDALIGVLWGAVGVVFGGAPPFEQLLLTDPSVADGDSWQKAMAAAGDLDQDGFDDVLVASNSVDHYGVDAGAVYWFRGGADSVTLAQMSRPPYRMGVHGVGSAGDTDGDGLPEAFVSGYVGDHGIVVLLEYDPAAKRLLHVRLPEPPGIQTYFGLTSTRGVGDVDGDGFDDLVVGMWDADYLAVNAGAAFLYRGGPGGLQDFERLDPPNPDVATHFGSGVGGAGDYNGDGLNDFVVNGSPPTGANSLYVFYGRCAEDADADGTCDPDDCDADDAAIFPGAVERCNGVDDDCDDLVDEGCDTADTADTFDTGDDTAPPPRKRTKKGCGCDAGSGGLSWLAVVALVAIRASRRRVSAAQPES